MKIHATLTFPVLFAISFSACNSDSGINSFKDSVTIPAYGNSWVTNNTDLNRTVISRDGITGWDDPGSIIQTYFKIENPGKIRAGIRARTSEPGSVIECIIDEKSRKVKLSNNDFDTIDIGSFVFDEPGYKSITVKGLSKTGRTFADISDFFIKGTPADSGIFYVKDDFYWGRRGPSVHLRYDIPEDAVEVEWFYNEITVQEGNDVLGSYFMADGFTDGYFGIQVNSPEERRILFSVWSPFKTDNPGDIPEDSRIILLKKGNDVYAGEFGNEGSGGQSYRKYMWKAGATYGFLLHGKPSAGNCTDYTAYFFAPEIGKWELIAGFRRPKGSRYLGNLYSFLENFRTESGYLKRRAEFSNQWIRTSSGKWIELTGARFTADATARKESRLDYAGGADGKRFYLMNCGFFDEMSEINSIFNRIPEGKEPLIDFSILE